VYARGVGDKVVWEIEERRVWVRFISDRRRERLDEYIVWSEEVSVELGAGERSGGKVSCCCIFDCVKSIKFQGQMFPNSVDQTIEDQTRREIKKRD
jgi:hypothetical protein